MVPFLRNASASSRRPRPDSCVPRTRCTLPINWHLFMMSWGCIKLDVTIITQLTGTTMAWLHRNPLCRYICTRHRFDTAMSILRQWLVVRRHRRYRFVIPVRCHITPNMVASVPPSRNLSSWDRRIFRCRKTSFITVVRWRDLFIYNTITNRK
jgi:hypothetical protein